MLGCGHASGDATGELNRMRHASTLVAAALLLASMHAVAQGAVSATPKVGDEHQITKRYETASQDSRGGSGSSRGNDAILERVIAVRDGGLELEFDLPKDATAEDRARNWQFPAR